METKKNYSIIIVCLLFCLYGMNTAQTFAASFQYEGRLLAAKTAADGIFDFKFCLFDSAVDGNRISEYINLPDVKVVDGFFAVELDFGAPPADINSVWMEIYIRPGVMDGPLGYTLLRPRHNITSALYEIIENPKNSGRIAALEERVAQLEKLLANVTRDGNDITFKALNVHIVNGLDNTETINGLGNLIVGYNELVGHDVDHREGSHNIVVGKYNSYYSYGGLLVGWQCRTGRKYSCAIGSTNTAWGEFSSAIGGGGNIAEGNQSSVSGGMLNAAKGPNSSITGGQMNTVNGGCSSITGGYQNISGLTSMDRWCSVSGGSNNSATGKYSTISGGYLRSVTGDYDWRAGGLFQDQ